MHARPLYAGAGSRLDLGGVAKLDRRWVVQPKLDGIYATITTDTRGRVTAAVTRAGEVLGPRVMSAYAGVRWVPSAVIVAELELWTEAARRASAARGYAMAHVFDVLRLDGRDLSDEPYSERRDALMRAEAWLETGDLDRPWLEDEQGAAHDLKTGRYTHPTPRSWRRVRVVPQLPARQYATAWSAWVDAGEAGPCEGLVAVRVDAPLGARNAKRKVKQATELDATVVALDARAVRLWWAAANRSIVVSRPSTMALAIGDVVEVTHEGFHDDGAPRFARLSRTRRDLTPQSVTCDVQT